MVYGTQPADHANLKFTVSIKLLRVLDEESSLFPEKEALVLLSKLLCQSNV